MSQFASRRKYTSQDFHRNAVPGWISITAKNLQAVYI